MVMRLLSRLRSRQNVPRVYSRVVSDEKDRHTVVELLREAAQEANADQKKLVQSAK